MAKLWGSAPPWYAGSQEQRAWTPSEWHGLYRALDRVLLDQYRDRYARTVAELDLDRMTDETKHLLRSVVQLKARILKDPAYPSRLVAEFPSLEPLAYEELDPVLPIRLADEPLGSFPYLTSQGILL